MGITIGTSARANLPLQLGFLYGGSDVNWGQPYKIRGLYNSGESVDGNYRISDMDVYFVDRYGSLFQNQFGNGTLGLGSSFQVVAYLGGTMEYSMSGSQVSWRQLGTTGAYDAVIHTGKICSISYSDRILRLRSKSRMANLGDLKWQFPVYSRAYDYTVYGSFAFRDGNLATTTFYGPYSFYDVEDNLSKWKAYAYVMGTAFGPNDYLHVNGYPPLAGRGTGVLPLYDPNQEHFYYPGTNSGGTNFYSEREPIKLDGTYFGTLLGTINTDEEARYYGYANAAVAESAKSGTRYIVDRSRFKAQGTFTGSFLHMLCPIRFIGNPKSVFQSMIYGQMVTPLFSASDVDTTALDESGSNTNYFGFDRKVWYNESKVLDSLKDLFSSTQALFYVNTSNKFEFRTYGPRNLSQTIESIGTDNIVSSSFENLEEDYFNRFVFKYKYDSQSGEFGSTYEEKASNWVLSSDRPLFIESKFVANSNEAVVLTQRLKSRYAKTSPHIDFTTNINQLGLEIGTLLQITDPNSGLVSKTVQIVGYNKDWENKTIKFECFDGEALYQRRGYCFWEGDNNLTAVVSGTSTAGWGTSGTVANINTTLYGTQFVWW